LGGFFRELNVGTRSIELGLLWQNSFAESFNAGVKDEPIKVELFRSMKEAEVVGDNGREAYNKSRPHSALRSLTSAAFAAIQWLPKRPEGRLPRPAARHLLFVQIWERIRTRRLS
jgi:hypothetical protein